MTVAHKPYIMLVGKAIQKWTIFDIAVPRDFNVVITEDWKVEKYQDLASELKRESIMCIARQPFYRCDWSSRNSAKATDQVN